MISARAEQHRVAAHLLAAEGLAAARDLTGLDPLQRLVRHLLLAELARYRAAGNFPKNRKHREQLPTFVDGDGTRCAMAHLLELGGEHALVDKIRTERNHAYVKELADEPRLVAWLAAAGLTVAEAAAIQPSYCETGAACVCGEGWSNRVGQAKGVLEGVRISGGGTRIVRVTGDTDGIAAGDTLQLDWPGGVGADLLIVVPKDVTHLSDGGVYYPVAGELVDGKWSCTSMASSGGSVPGVTFEQYAKAKLSANCRGELIAINPVFGQGTGSCGGPFGCGCSGADPTSLGILLAIAGVLLARKLKA